MCRTRERILVTLHILWIACQTPRSILLDLITIALLSISLCCYSGQQDTLQSNLMPQQLDGSGREFIFQVVHGLGF